MSNNGLHITEFSSEPITIREAVRADLPALRRLAQRDTARMVDRPAVVALTGGEVRAALSLTSRSVIADPFHRTAELVELLRAHVRAMERSGRRPAPASGFAGRGIGRPQPVPRPRRAV
jgi:hypothetical protein